MSTIVTGAGSIAEIDNWTMAIVAFVAMTTTEGVKTLKRRGTIKTATGGAAMRATGM